MLLLLIWRFSSPIEAEISLVRPSDFSEPLLVAGLPVIAIERFVDIVVLDTDIVFRGVLEKRNLFSGECAYFHCRPAHVKMTALKVFAWRNKAACAHHYVFVDDDVVHDDGTDSDQAFISDCASMKNHGVADRYMTTDKERRAVRFGGILVRDMAHCEILNVGAVPNNDAIHITAKHGVAPD